MGYIANRHHRSFVVPSCSRRRIFPQYLGCLVFSLSFALAGTVQSAIYPEAERGNRIYKQASPSLVLITKIDNQGNTSYGSGFIYDKEGRVVTNYHVIRNARELTIRQVVSGELYDRVYVVDIDVYRDIALLRPEGFKGFLDERGKEIPTVGPITRKAGTDKKSSEKSRVGDAIWALTNPADLFDYYAKGVISSRRHVLDLVPGRENIIPPEKLYNVFLISPKIIAIGSSGGLLLDDVGEAIGLLTGAVGTDEFSAFAVPIWCINLLIEESKEHEEKPLQKYLSSERAREVEKIAENDPYYKGKLYDKWERISSHTIDGIIRAQDSRPIGNAQVKAIESEYGLLTTNLNLDFRSDLDRGDIPDGLRHEFESKGILLSQDASVLVVNREIEWLVNDDTRNESYIVKRDGDRLDIYRASGPRVYRGKPVKTNEEGEFKLQIRKQEGLTYTIYIEHKHYGRRKFGPFFIEQLLQEYELPLRDDLTKSVLFFRVEPSTIGLKRSSGKVYPVCIVRQRGSPSPKFENSKWKLQGLLLFSIDSEYEELLDKAIIPEGLQQKFGNNEVVLPQDATITVEKSGIRWLINGAGRTYAIRKESNQLNVYLEGDAGCEWVQVRPVEGITRQHREGPGVTLKYLNGVADSGTCADIRFVLPAHEKWAFATVYPDEVPKEAFVSIGGVVTATVGGIPNDSIFVSASWSDKKVKTGEMDETGYYYIEDIPRNAKIVRLQAEGDRFEMPDDTPFCSVSLVDERVPETIIRVKARD